MPKKGERRDPLLDNPCVIAYRDIVHLQLNYLQRQLVAEKVQATERGLRIWKSTLIEYMQNGRNPKLIPTIIKLWENVYYDPGRIDPCWKDNSERVWHDG